LVSAFVASPAQASIADCGNYPGTICFADTRSWGGRIWRQYPSQIVGCRKFAPDSFNNLASIGVNNTDDSAPPVGIDLYDADNCTGTPVFVASGYSVNLWATTPNLENKASSIRVVYF
jgi:hypothetical protein